MPELPEVETIKRVLEPQLKSLEISDITANRTDIIAYPSAEIFCEKIKNQTISAMDRRGKFLIIVLDYRNTPFLQVYGHDGEVCPVCGEILCRTVIGGRSSVYCPGCQRNLN